MSDWRLNGQERYLYGVKLKHMNIKDKLNPSDHEHCEFCLEKISNYHNTIHDAYCTEEEYHWVCDNCYNDFKARFNWK